MRYKSIRIKNYKSFRDSGQICFNPKFNLIVGSNDSGKTSLLESLSARTYAPIPHRNLSKAPTAIPNPVSTVDVTVELVPGDLEEFVRRTRQSIKLYTNIDNKNLSELSMKRVFNELNTDCFLINIFGSGVSGNFGPHSNYQSAGRTSNIVKGAHLASINESDEIEFQFLGSQDDNINDIASSKMATDVYVFRAERLGIGKYSSLGEEKLASNAANLAQVLNTMRSKNPIRYRRYCNHVNEIFPTIRDIKIIPSSTAHEAEIFVSKSEPTLERDDLDFSLEHSGTGVSQVLAILYVVMTSPAGVIVIDEPNSFLHPGAARRLIEIIKFYDHHQYIISTHSADLINASGVKDIHHVTWSNGESSVEVIPSTQLDQMRGVLSDLGVSFSDVFGHDKVVWVEGETEETCFPLLAAVDGIGPKIAWRKVSATSDFGVK